MKPESPVIRAIIALLFVYCFSGGDELRIRMLMHFTRFHDFDNWINLKHKEEIVRMFFRRYLMCLNVMIILLTCSLYKQVKCVFILVNDSICYIPLALHDVMNFYASKIFYQQLCHFCFKVLSDEFSYYFKFFWKVFKFWFKKLRNISFLHTGK